MEVAESPTVGFPNPLSTAESIKAKKKNTSHKDKRTHEHFSNAPTNGTIFSPALEDDESRPSKRKRDSESGHKKRNKKRREAEDDGHGELDPHEQSHMFDEEEDKEHTADVNMNTDNTPSNDTREPDQTASGEASLLEGTQDPATPSEGRLKRRRSHRIGGKNKQKVGFFIEEEVKALEEFKIQFCNTHGMAGGTFDAMVQHSERGGEEWPVQTHICTKADFWNDVYSLIPDRDRRSVYRFMRRHFQDTTQKAHDWTPEQDEELIKLHAQHGPKYAHIAKLLGRSDDDVTQRWKNRLQHRATKKTGAWSEEELRAFMSSLEEYRNLLLASSAEPQKAGKDIWDMDLKSISWGSISNGMENSRTRQQCADKWRKIQKNVTTLRQTLAPDVVFDPVEAVRKHHRWNRVAAGEKSKTFVEDDDDDDDEETRIPSTTPAIIPKLELATEQQTLDLARVARAASVESSPAQNRNDVVEDSDDPEDELPSSPLSEHSRSEVKKLLEEKKERKRRKREKKERKRQEAAEAAVAAADSAEEVEEPSPPTEKKHKKRRKSEANGSEMNDLEPTESSKKKGKKDKKKKSKKAAEGDADVDDISD